jgi:Tol biopolymer transport system component
MNEQLLRRALLEAPLPAQHEAEQRAWRIVGAAFRRRAAAPQPRLRPRLALAFVVLVGLLAVLALTPAGAKVSDWIRDVIEPGERAHPALASLPAPGRLLVDSPRGPWIVDQHGSKRLLGTYDQATWSPQGLYVAATRRHQLTALVADPAVIGEPAGTPHWSLTRPQRVGDPVWAPSGVLVAYLAGHSLRLVWGNGTHDHALDRHVLHVAPSWRPDPSGHGNALAYVDADHRVRVVDIDAARELWRSAPIGGSIAALDWSADGRRLLLVGRGFFVVLGRNGRPIGKGPVRGSPEDAAFSPSGREIALARHTLEGTSELVLVEVDRGGIREQPVLSRPGHFTDIAWSPDGNWLLVPWREADTWLFVRPSDRKVSAYSGISRQFAPGSSGRVGLPRPAGWCCTATR